MSIPSLAAGGIIGHYRVIERVGEGGMGVVYRAHDQRLGRDVAIKLLPANALHDEISQKRLHREARALAKLNHPNIATIYDSDSQDGIDFLVVEFVPGETLTAKLASRALPESEVLRLGMQLAEGLSAAHEAGVLHRDLKPGNLQLTPNGRLKILDFGLAQFSAAASGATTESVADLRCAGTLPYAAPEQLCGEPASVMSDIYSAGAVLYEMCTGRRAFGVEPAFRAMHSIIHEMPKPPRELNSKLSLQLEQIILKCLDKDPHNRYQSAVELSVDLRRLSQGSSTGQIIPYQSKRAGARKVLMAITGCALLLSISLGLNPSWVKRFATRDSGQSIQSLAVLPLKNFSGDADQDYFADGMTEEMITDLAQIRALRVISRTSVMNYKGSTKSLPQIARELNVDAVLEGSVERDQDRVRVNAQLILARTDQHLWAKSYARNIGDVLALQGELARAIAGEIQIKLTAEELRRLSRTRAVNPQAHEDYLRGRYYWNKRTTEGVEKSVEYLEKAVAEDPQYALAYAALSDSYHLLPDLAASADMESFQKARTAALKALELDPSLAEAHASVAKVKEDYDWDWAGAEYEYQQAIDLNPGLGIIHAWYANLLAETGRVPEALAESREALQLDPISGFVNSNLASMLYFARQYDAAIEQSRKALNIDPGSARAHRNLGRIYAAQGLYEKATVEFQKAIELSPGASEYLAELGSTFARQGHRDKAAEILNQLDHQPKTGKLSYERAIVYVGMGDKQRSLNLLQQALEGHATGLVQLKVAHWFDDLRSEPAFRQVMEQVGLPN